MRRPSLLILTCMLTALAGREVSLAADAHADSLRREAELFERRGDWERAGQAYYKLLTSDRTSDELRRKFLLCSRHLQQASRHRDRLYLDRVRGLTLSQAMIAYLDALGKLQANYVDRDKIALSALYRAGIEELQFALRDPVFRQEHLAAVSDLAIRAFEARIRDEWANAGAKQADRVRETVRTVALEAQKALGVKPGLVVMEFVCGACNALDEHSAYLPPGDETAIATSQLAGLGAVVNVSADGQLFIERIVPGSWAASSGLKDGERIHRLGRAEGDDSLLVEIEVGLRGEMPRVLKLPAIFPVIAEAQVTPDGIGYLRLGAFTRQTMPEVNELLMDPRMRGMKALILDLRGHPGGLLSAAVQLAERFVPEGIIVTTQGQAAPFNRTFSSHSGMTALDLPLFVLVDGETASAAEVLAAALKENDRAMLVGQPTLGKGTMQQVLQLSTGGGMRITLARMFTPRGHPFQRIGVSPQLPVPSTRAREEATTQARQTLMMRP